MKSVTIFIVPLGATKSLTENGWTFASSMPLSPRIIDKVITHFNVHLIEEYLGIRKFQNEQTQISVVFNDEGAPTEVSVRMVPCDNILEKLRFLLSDEAVILSIQIVPVSGAVLTLGRGLSRIGGAVDWHRFTSDRGAPRKTLANLA